jgi:hypothetical protein
MSNKPTSAYRMPKELKTMIAMANHPNKSELKKLMVAADLASKVKVKVKQKPGRDEPDLAVD